MLLPTLPWFRRTDCHVGIGGGLDEGSRATTIRRNKNWFAARATRNIQLAKALVHKGITCFQQEVISGAIANE